MDPPPPRPPPPESSAAYYDYYADPSAVDSPSPTRRGLQGPRPTPLRVHKDSHKIAKKPPLPHHLHHLQPPAQQLPAPSITDPQPIIIYAVSPKVIHTTVDDFRQVVQRLTGSSSSESFAAESSGGGALSPAARLASIEKTSPSEREREKAAVAAAAAADILEILESSNFEVGQIPGILSPAPATLPPISPAGLFSPSTLDPFMLMGGSNMFTPSPSTLFSSPTLPSPSSIDLYSQFFDF